MPQCQLPIFAEGVTNITPEIGYQLKDGKVFYFNGHLPVFQSRTSGSADVSPVDSQLIDNGNATRCRSSRRLACHWSLLSVT